MVYSLWTRRKQSVQKRLDFAVVMEVEVVGISLLLVYLVEAMVVVEVGRISLQLAVMVVVTVTEMVS